ncbi:MAG: phosphoribosylaminoimidazolesuccinocarboxamide synthase [Fimbriimonadaceae bacterium]|nr:phosphoribosylaminoimidazolesuccinocarboxamide synthase [Fimbriimonadaceae bacterium]QYK56922.1 MAG: phosphoribosylaminoimidazolesuccinocarboxamide synthase [Fimbriimonadaceae bacterium]
MALLSAEGVGLPLVHRGKVRDVFDLGDALLFVATDRVSAFDVVMENGVPDKGRLLNQISNFWFEKLAATGPNHLLSTQDEEIVARVPGWTPELEGRSALVRKTRPLTFECVVRGYLAGSLYKDYMRDGGRVHGLDLPSGLLDGSRLPEPIFSPATKAQEGHDENVSYARMESELGADVARQAREWSLELFRAASEHAATVGLILADTKFEFGLASDGLVWIDEALTPDSSRYWEASAWKPGGPQPSFDKQPLRDWLEASGWDKKPPGPRLPEAVVKATRERYVSAFERLTGQRWPAA